MDPGGCAWVSSYGASSHECRSLSGCVSYLFFWVEGGAHQRAEVCSAGVFVCVGMFLCVCVVVCVLGGRGGAIYLCSVCLVVCVCVFICEREREREREREGERECVFVCMLSNARLHLIDILLLLMRTSYFC